MEKEEVSFSVGWDPAEEKAPCCNAFLYPPKGKCRLNLHIIALPPSLVFASLTLTPPLKPEPLRSPPLVSSLAALPLKARLLGSLQGLPIVSSTLLSY